MTIDHLRGRKTSTKERWRVATYNEIREWVLKEYGIKLHTGGCHIAHCKELAGIELRKNTWNRRGQARVMPCPPNHREAIFAAFRHFNMLPSV